MNFASAHTGWKTATRIPTVFMKNLLQSRPILVLLLLSLPASVSSQITLVVDLTSQTLYFSGSDSGDSLDLSGVGALEVVTWQWGSAGGTSETLGVGASFDTTFNDSSMLSVSNGVPPMIRLSLSNIGGPADSIMSIVANSGPIDYTTLSLSHISILEGADGEVMALDQGTGYGGIAIAVIPEPSSIVAVAGILALAAVGLIRWRHYKSVQA